jgi:hypothetical protein
MPVNSYFVKPDLKGRFPSGFFYRCNIPVTDQSDIYQGSAFCAVLNGVFNRRDAEYAEESVYM